MRHLATGLEDAALWGAIDEAARGLEAIERLARQIAQGFAMLDTPKGPVAYVDASAHHGAYDKTMLLLMGQERARIAVVLDRDNVTLAAPFDSGVSFLDLLSLSGGMPTLVSVGRARLAEALRLLGVAEADVQRVVP